MSASGEERAMRDARRAQSDARREVMRAETVAAVAEEFGAPTEPVCKDWPHRLCVKWTLPNGVEIHVRARHDGPHIDAFDGPCGTNRRWASMPPSRINERPSIAEWLRETGLLPKNRI